MISRGENRGKGVNCGNNGNNNSLLPSTTTSITHIPPPMSNERPGPNSPIQSWIHPVRWILVWATRVIKVQSLNLKFTLDAGSLRKVNTLTFPLETLFSRARKGSKYFFPHKYLEIQELLVAEMHQWGPSSPPSRENPGDWLPAVSEISPHPKQIKNRPFWGSQNRLSQNISNVSGMNRNPLTP